MMTPRNRRKPDLSLPLLVSMGLLCGCGAPGSEQESAADLETGSVQQALTEIVPDQTKLNSFYAFDNIVNISISLPDDVWTAIKTEPPNPPPPGNCVRVPVDASGESPSRYQWRPATAVTVSDSKGLSATFISGVDIRKKSYCGSLTMGADQQPSLKLRFASPTAVNAMGAQYLDLHNSVQDSSLIRQTLGYYLYGLAGLPHSRANYAKVTVRTPSKTENYVYVNVEPIRSGFIANPANGFTNRTVTQSGSADAKVPGNLYEFELGDDFDSGSLGFVGLEKPSAIQSKSKPDLTFAANQIALGTTTGLTNVINTDQFAKIWAMEVLLKHWDGYAVGRNNTYVYNDVVATSGTQSASTVDFKFIPWGIDQILLPNVDFQISENSKIGKIMRNNPTMYNKLISGITSVRQSVFSRDLLDGDINTRIDTLRSQLIGLGKDTTTEIDKIRVQLKLARAAAIMLSGSNSSSFYVADKSTGEVMHASNTEQVGAIYFEVYHRPSARASSDRWIIGSNSNGLTLISEAYGRALYATANITTSLGHLFVLTEPAGNFELGEGWDFVYDGTSYPDGKLKDFPGTFSLRSGRTGQSAHFSNTDLTPLGRPRIYQGAATPVFMY